MGQSYLFPLSGGSGGGGNATETIRDNVVKDNLINYNKIMDFPELIQYLEERNIEYNEYYFELYPSESALRILLRETFLSCQIPLYQYIVNQPKSTREDQIYTFSYYYRVNIPMGVDLRIDLTAEKISDTTEDIDGGGIFRRVITFKTRNLADLRLTIDASLINYMNTVDIYFSSMKLEYGDIVTNWVPIETVENVIRITMLHNERIILSNVKPNSDVVMITTSDFIEGRRLEVIHVGTSWEDTFVAPVYMTDEEFYTVASYNDGMLELFNQASTRFYQDETVQITIIGNNLKLEE